MNAAPNKIVQALLGVAAVAVIAGSVGLGTGGAATPSNNADEASAPDTTERAAPAGYEPGTACGVESPWACIDIDGDGDLDPVCPGASVCPDVVEASSHATTIVEQAEDTTPATVQPIPAVSATLPHRQQGDTPASTTSSSSTTTSSSSTTSSTTTTSTVPPATNCDGRYSPKAGDTWQDIAVIFHVTVDRLVSANPDTDRPRPGRAVCIPGIEARI